MYDRVHVLGCPGSGKTTLGQFIGERMGLPVVDLDDIYHGPRWQPPDPDVFRPRVSEIASQPRFVISGNYSSAWDARIKAEDMVIMLELPRLTCVRRIAWRSLEIRFGGRIDLLPEACRAGPDHEPLRDYPAFIRFTWACAGRRPARLAHLAQLGIRQFIDLQGTRRVAEFVAAVDRDGGAAFRGWLGPLPQAR